MLAVLDKHTTTNLEEMILTEEQLSLLLRREEEAIVLTEEQVLSELLEFINNLNPDNNEHILSGLAAINLYTNPKFNISKIQTKGYKANPRYEILVSN